MRKIYRLIHYLLFYVPLKNFSLIWRHHHCRWRAAKYRPMLGAQGLWAGRDYLSSHTCCNTGPQFVRFHPKDRPIQSLQRHAWGCRGPVLTRILTGIKWKKTLWLKRLKRLIDWLIICCFTFRSISFNLYRDVTLTGEELQNLGQYSVLRALEQGGIFTVPYLLFFRSHPKYQPI
jgi:hypothetical protein